MKLNRKLLIYVENISPTSSEQNLQAYLEKFAPVQGVYFLREKQCTKRSIAAFLRVANETDRDCIMLRNQQNYRGKRLFMLRADQPHDYQAEQTIIVRNITNKISEENLYDHFQDCGTIAFLQIRTDDFAYVTFEDKSSVKNAMSKNNQPLKGSSLKIQLLTRNLDIMIVSLDTLPSRMPDLYRMLIMPLEPRASSGEQQQQQQPAVQSQPPVVKQPQSQQQPKFQPNQQPQAQRQQQQQQQQSQQSRQQNQQQQQRENQQRLQRENQQLQQQAQAQQQRLQQQQQLLQQQRPLPQRQQNQRQQQQGLQQQQQQIQQQIQMLKEKANALAGKQQQQQQQQKQAVPEQPKPIPKPQEVPKKQQEVDPVPAASSSQSDTDDVQIVEIVETQQIIEDDDDDDEEVQIVEKPTVEPIPSDYVAKPDDVMRPVKASELVLKDVPKLKSEDDRRSVWVNNIQPETRRLDLVLYMEQFGDVMHCKIGNSNNCAFTRWAKIMFTTEDGAARAAEYFLHPFQGRYLFVLQCSKYVVEEPGKVFVIDYLSKYVVYEDVVKAFKHIGEVFYLVRLYDNNYKVRIFFLNQVDEKAVLAVDSIDGRPAKLELYIENMVLRLPKTLAKELKEAREIKDPEKEARMARITEIYKEEALDRYATREYTNPDPKTSPVEVVIYNVPVGTTDQQIKRFFKSIGEPTAIRRVPIETETHTVRDAECVYVGFRTLSMALQAAEISPERTLNSFNPFIFTAWSQAAMTDRNTIRLFFNKYISMQDIYNGLIHCGQIKYIEKQRAKRALVVFGNGENGVLNAKRMNFIGDTKITCKGAFVATRLDLHAEKKKKQAEAKQPPAAAIVIEDEDEVVVVPSDNSPDKKQNQKGQNLKQGPSPIKQQQQQGQRQKQQHQQQQQRQQQQRSGGNRNRNSNSFGDDGPPHRHQQQRNQMNPWQNNNQGPIWNDQFQRRDQFPHNDEFNFQRNQNPFMQGDRFNPDGGPFDRFGNQGPNRNMNMNEFEQMMMAQQFDNFNLNSNNGFIRGNPMDSDDPPLGRPWGQNQQNFDRFSPPGRRSPFNREFPDDHDQDFDRDSPGIPSNIPEEDIDEYILRKQEAIKRRLEQLDRQLITSVETSRQRDFQRAARHRQGTVFSDNGDVHYVPNPAAVARNRGRGGRGGNFGGGRRGGGKGGDAAEGPSRGRGRRDRNELMKNRARDPFADVDIVPIIRISEDRSPSPKRSREDEFDAAQFNAAWN